MCNGIMANVIAILMLSVISIEPGHATGITRQFAFCPYVLRLSPMRSLTVCEETKDEETKHWGIS